MNNDIRTEEQETVSGIVDSIIYQNEDNGYVVFEMEDTSGYPVTVTGIIPYLTDGDKLTVTGKWVNHKTYGKQKLFRRRRATFCVISRRVRSRESARKLHKR